MYRVKANWVKTLQRSFHEPWPALQCASYSGIYAYGSPASSEGSPPRFDTCCRSRWQFSPAIRPCCKRAAQPNRSQASPLQQSTAVATTRQPQRPEQPLFGTDRIRNGQIRVPIPSIANGTACPDGEPCSDSSYVIDFNKNIKKREVSMQKRESEQPNKACLLLFAGRYYSKQRREGVQARQGATAARR